VQPGSGRRLARVSFLRFRRGKVTHVGRDAVHLTFLTCMEALMRRVRYRWRECGPRIQPRLQQALSLWVGPKSARIPLGPHPSRSWMEAPKRADTEADWVTGPPGEKRRGSTPGKARRCSYQFAISGCRNLGGIRKRLTGARRPEFALMAGRGVGAWSPWKHPRVPLSLVTYCVLMCHSTKMESQIPFWPREAA
jgi:hypothetical protein